MALSDSMFLVEITVQELKSYVNCREFIIKSQFADVFSITLKDHNEQEKVLTKSPQSKYSKRKCKICKHSRQPLTRPPPKPKVQRGQSMLIAKDIENLVLNMQKYPIELSLWSKLCPKYKLASTNVPWSKKFIDYLRKAQTKDSEPVSAKGEYNVFDEYTSRRMAVVKLNIQLSYLSDKITKQIESLSENPSEIFTFATLDSKTSTEVNQIEKDCFKQSKIMNTVNIPKNLPEDTGIIRTIYKGKGATQKPNRIKTIQKKENITIKVSEPALNVSNNVEELTKSNTVNSSIISLVKSESDIDRKKHIDLTKYKSCSSINRDHLRILNYIFGNHTGPFGNKVYCVNYFTVENDNINSPKTSDKSAKSSPTSVKTSPNSDKSSNPETSEQPQDKQNIKFKLCDKECLYKKNESGSCDLSLSSIDIPIPKELSDYTHITKCNKVTCEDKKFRQQLPPTDERILLDLSSLKNECCDQETVQVAGEMKARMKIGDDPCYCECECRFGFTKKTVYCKVCGGYESVGDELGEHLQTDMPFPCPIYHKIPDKTKTKTVSVTGSDIKKTSKKAPQEKSSQEKASQEKSDKKSIESDKESKKGKKKKKENKFKFNYGYTAAKIGHSGCLLSCGGFQTNPVPKRMGWLWNSDKIPGMKFRPSWKPGAVSKHVVKLLKVAKNPEEALAKKKRRRDAGKPKKPLKRPLIVVRKTNGEYTVTMETMKPYNKPRTVAQAPYEEKSVTTFKIGRTEEENLQRRKKKERARRRLERDQRDFIQSAFKNMCQDICLKTYQQALGILPDAEIPKCPCYPAEPCEERTDMDFSCSCSEDSNLTESDTDSDEWNLEFTPPIAHFDPTRKIKKVVHADNGTQYTYLDYRVKLLDRYGNPVPRFFKGPDGKEQCSDLGGFWSPDHKWLEINVDGYIAPDGKWAPNIFIGPNNESIDAELGKFQTHDGTWLVVGIDGYVDSQGRWQAYAKSKLATKPTTKRRRVVPTGVKQTGAGDKKDEIGKKKSEATWSCFGDVSAKYLSEMGIMGHGHDRKVLLDTLNKLVVQGQDVKIPQPSTVPRSPYKKGKGKPHSISNDKKCRHAKPSAKGIIAVDGYGNKTYFKLRDYKNKRPVQRIATLTDQGISVSSFHMPCFRSFISREIMKKQQYERLEALAKKRGDFKGRDQKQHNPGPYQHDRRFQTSAKAPIRPPIDTNQYKNIIV